VPVSGRPGTWYPRTALAAVPELMLKTRVQPRRGTPVGYIPKRKNRAWHDPSESLGLVLSCKM